jgi:hypothetical protein
MTKQQILQQVSEEQIIQRYLPDFNPRRTKNYRSPFSDKDDKPSLNFYREQNSWRFKSHNTGHQGDVFQFVADLKNLDCKKQFTSVLETITQDLSLNGFDINHQAPLKPNTPKRTADKKTLNIIYENGYTKAFLDYFHQFKISVDELVRFNVRQVKMHEFVSNAGKKLRFDYGKSGQIVACYLVNERIKLYLPFIQDLQEKAFGYKDQTANDIFGFEQAKNKVAELNSKLPFLIVAAGEKDCLALNANGFDAISFQSENTIPISANLKEVALLSDTIYIAYDNDEAGKKAAEKLAKESGWSLLTIPSAFKDIAEFFKANTAEDFKPMVTVAAKPAEPVAPEEPPPGFTIFHAVEQYLDRHYNLRFNTIKLELEISPRNENNFEPLNENDLFVEMNKRGVRIGMDKLITILKSSYVPKFNPLRHYFESLPPWDEETDHLAQLSNHLHCTDQAELSIQFQKWMVRAVRCALEPSYYNKQALILVHSEQNSGKTSFCRFLCPPALQDYIAENISDDKDSRIALAKNFLINLDELSSLAKHEINSLKSLFSKDIINERLPYDRKNSIIHRVSSFIGSTNMAEFLTDETGSVRWLCFEIKGIDWKYRQNIQIDQCWAMAYSLFREGIDCDMSRDEIECNEKRNSKFQQRTAESEIIPEYLLPGSENDQGSVFLNATQIMVYIQIWAPTLRINKINIGRAMAANGFLRTKDTSHDRYGYWVLKRK